MSLRFVAVLVASVFASVLPGGSMLEAMSDDPHAMSEHDNPSLADLAAEAGAAAALAAHCNTDPAPLRSAYAQALSVAAVDIATRRSLWRRFDAAESAGASALIGLDPAQCTNPSGMVKNTVHDVERPSAGSDKGGEGVDP
jgi:hypothetical protein